MKNITRKLLCMLCMAAMLLCSVPAVAAGLLPQGDLNKNGVLESNDTLLLRSAILEKSDAPAPERSLADGDLNRNGKLDSHDYILLRRAILKGETDAFLPATASESTIENIDFIVDVPTGRDIKILQLSDTQIINMEDCRNSYREGCLDYAFFKQNGVYDIEKKLWRHIDYLVRTTLPDLIVLAGDAVYGECDDSGVTWLALIEHMDSYGIPWALTFGNHDNESAKGVRWQIEQLQKSEYCVFAQGSVSGNSNYNVAMRQDGEIKYMVYMLDTNGCRIIDQANGEGILADNVDYDMLVHTEGLQPDQVNWYQSTANAINQAQGNVIPSLVFMHIHPLAMSEGLAQRYSPSSTSFNTNKDTDIGKMNKYTANGGIDRDHSFFSAAKEVGTTGIYFGHEHTNYSSIVYEGIRMTYGLKTGTYCDYDRTGGTLTTIDTQTKELSVQHIFTAYTSDSQ